MEGLQFYIQGLLLLSKMHIKGKGLDISGASTYKIFLSNPPFLSTPGTGESSNIFSYLSTVFIYDAVGIAESMFVHGY